MRIAVAVFGIGLIVIGWAETQPLKPSQLEHVAGDVAQLEWTCEGNCRPDLVEKFEGRLDNSATWTNLGKTLVTGSTTRYRYVLPTTIAVGKHTADVRGCTAEGKCGQSAQTMFDVTAPPVELPGTPTNVAVTKVPPAPAEDCGASGTGNGQDENGNGVIDEGCVVEPPPEELCGPNGTGDGIDNDGDKLIDEGCLDPSQPVPSNAVQASHMVYEGAFRLPAGYESGGYALVKNPAQGGGLFVGGSNQRLGEINIPTPSKATSLAQLPEATVKQALRDPFEGKRAAVINGGDLTALMGGALVYNGQMYLTSYQYYDGSGSQQVSHFRRPIDLSVMGQVTGPFGVCVAPWCPAAGWVSGPMTLIPSTWRGQFGAPAITGQCCIPIISRTSSGPAAITWDPAVFPTTAWQQLLLLYPQDHPLANFTDPKGNDLFSGPTQVKGVIFPDGTRSILYFGRHGTGPYCYGYGVNQNPPPPHPLAPNEQNCYDPVIPDKGNHTYPYHYQVWAYDANDLLQVKAGIRSSWDVKPYAFWRLTPPFAQQPAELYGAAWDVTTRRIYVTQAWGDGPKPLVLVYSLTTPQGTAAPAKLTKPAKAAPMPRAPVGIGKKPPQQG